MVELLAVSLGGELALRRHCASMHGAEARHLRSEWQQQWARLRQIIDSHRQAQRLTWVWRRAGGLSYQEALHGQLRRPPPHNGAPTSSVLQAAFRIDVPEGDDPAAVFGERRQKHLKKLARWQALNDGPQATFSLVEAAGLSYAFKLLKDSFIPSAHRHPVCRPQLSARPRMAAGSRLQRAGTDHDCAHDGHPLDQHAIYRVGQRQIEVRQRQRKLCTT